VKSARAQRAEADSTGASAAVVDAGQNHGRCSRVLADLTRSLGCGSDGDVTGRISTNPWSATGEVIERTG
jgi:hypothetical protein